MNRKDSINLAREAQEQVAKEMPPNTFDLDLFYERFAELVRADEREAFSKIQFESILQAIKIEREACAKVCDARYMGDNNREDMEAKRCAAAIRARGNT